MGVSERAGEGRGPGHARSDGGEREEGNQWEYVGRTQDTKANHPLQFSQIHFLYSFEIDQGGMRTREKNGGVESRPGLDGGK